MVGHGQVHPSLGRVAYGLLFVAILPLMLLAWSLRLDAVVRLPAPPWQGAGIVLCAAGTALMALAMLDLFVHGHGLPMNAFPPQSLVTRGAYAWFSHPIYLGAVLTSLGASLWAQSGSGLYVITPALALGCTALVLGYERLALRRLFGTAVDAYHPLFGLPPASQGPAGWAQKAAMLARIGAPWLLAGFLIDFARCGHAGALGCAPLFRTDLLRAEGWQGLAGAAWALPFLALAVALLVARRQAQVRSLAIAGSLATAGFLFVDLVGPTLAGETVFRDGAWSRDAVWLLASVALVASGLAYRSLWRTVQRASEWVANSRRDWLFWGGRVRVISHSLASFLAGAVSAAILGYATGEPLAGPWMVLFALGGAALYAQLSWGSSALLRPFGFWGGVPGAALGVVVLWQTVGVAPAQLALGIVLAAPFAQAVGRLRCLAQGCCHGVPTDARFGIRVWQPQARVCMYSGLKGRYILITQTYSILFNLALGVLLIAMARQGIAVTLLAGAYLFLTSSERFAEDGYRGETQTRVMLGLKEPQWIALGGLAAGILCTCLPPVYASPAGVGGAWLAVGAVLAGLITAFALSVDFPRSHARFARLSG